MLFGKTPSKGRVLQNVLIFLVILFVSLWSLWPVVLAPATSLVNAGDEIILTWIINQNIQKIPYNLNNLFQGNIFHPYKNTIAYSDIFLPASLISYIPVKISGFPILAYNINLFAGQILTMLVVYFWFLDITKDKAASLLGAIVLAVSQIRMEYYAHLHTWNMQWWLLGAWMVWKYVTKRNIKYLLFSGLAVAIQFWESPFPVFLLSAITVFILSTHISVIKKDFRRILLIGIMVFLLVSPALKVYYNVSSEFEYKRSIRDAAHFSMSVDELWGRFFSPGLYSLFLISVVLSGRKFFRNLKKEFWLIDVLIFGVVMSLGPVLKWQGETFKFFDKIFIPLPYGVFYYIIPGFGALRTPLRWLWISAFAASGIIALTFSFYKSKYKTLFLLAAFIIAILGGRQAPIEAHAPKPNQYPRVYSFIKNLEGDVIIELPMYTWGFGNVYKNEFWRMLYSLEHKKKLVNGASGFSPPELEILAHQLWEDFPNPLLEEKLKSLEIDYVVIHKDEFEENKLNKIQLWWKENLLYDDPVSSVYEL